MNKKFLQRIIMGSLIFFGMTQDLLYARGGGCCNGCQTRYMACIGQKTDANSQWGQYCWTSIRGVCLKGCCHNHCLASLNKCTQNCIAQRNSCKQNCKDPKKNCLQACIKPNSMCRKECHENLGNCLSKCGNTDNYSCLNPS